MDLFKPARVLTASIKAMVRELKEITKRVQNVENVLEKKNYELSTSLSTIPKNCSFSESCPKPAKNMDLDRKYLCVEHSDKGRWK